MLLLRTVAALLLFTLYAHVRAAVTVPVKAIGFSLVVCSMYTAVTAFAAEASSGVPSIAEATRVLAQVPSIHDIQLSPDGRWIVYAIKRGSVDTNEITQSSVLQRLPQEASAPLPRPITLPATASAIRWHPDSQRLSMIMGAGPGESVHGSSFVYYNVATGEVTPIPFMRGTLESAAASGVKVDFDSAGSDYQWSPRGRFVAFTAPLAERGGLDPRRGVLGSEQEVSTSHGLFVLEVATGLVKSLTADTLDVVQAGFSWAPDESVLAVTVLDRVEFDGDNFFNKNILVVERQSGTARPLVTLRGLDRKPAFSPDGRWIAFATEFGKTNGGRFPAAMPRSAGPMVSFPPHLTPIASGPIFWRPDNQTLIYPALIDNRGRLVRADILTREIQPLRMPEGELPHDGDFSFSRDGRWMAYTRESVNLPKELFVIALDEAGQPVGAPRQLTHFAAPVSFAALVRADVVSWQSADGQATIHGALLTPKAAWRRGRIATPLPTVLLSCGANGVSFMNLNGNSVFYGLQLALAARGYAVLCPMVRGNQGYGEAFGAKVSRPVRRHFWREVFDDAMTGLDYLIEQGITDAGRLGMMGHSTDSMLTQYATVRTDRLKAAVMYEGIITDYSWYALRRQPHVDNLSLYHVMELAGAWDMFDPAHRAQILAESPAHNADRVTTPSLMLCGAVKNGFADRECKPWADLLERFCVPSAYFVYDEPHGFERPAAVADFLTRIAEWMDFWVRGIPYPDAGRAREYDRWRSCKKGVYTDPG